MKLDMTRRFGLSSVPAVKKLIF